MKKRMTLGAALVLLIASAVVAQNAAPQAGTTPATPIVKKSDPRRLAILLMPQYTFVNGLRIDFDIKLKQNNRLVIAPQFFVRQNPHNTFYTSMKGVGLSIYDKILLRSSSHNVNFYLGYGVTYNFMSMNNVETDVIFEKLSELNVHKVGPDAIIGLQLSPGSQFFFDVYTGVAIRYSFSSSGATIPKNISKGILSYGYTGVTPLLGLKVGLFL